MAQSREGSLFPAAEVTTSVFSSHRPACESGGSPTWMVATGAIPVPMGPRTLLPLVPQEVLFSAFYSFHSCVSCIPEEPPAGLCAISLGWWSSTFPFGSQLPRSSIPAPSAQFRTAFRLCLGSPPCTPAWKLSKGSTLE